MLSISQQQAGQRWDIITPQLREALFSGANADTVWNLCQGEHLSEDKSYQVAEYAGYVLLGFIRPEDLFKELVESLDLAPQSAKKISDEINSKIFSPLSADIDNVFAQTSATSRSEAVVAPKIINDIDISAKASVPQPPQSIDLSTKGWSTIKAGAVPAIPLSTIPSPVRPNAVPIPAPKTITQPIPPTPAPMILQKETPTSVPQKNADFHIPKSNTGAQMEFSKEKEQIKVMPAVIEFNKNAGSITTPANPVIPTIPSNNNTGGLMRNSELRPPLSSATISGFGARTITEITSTPIAPPKLPTSIPIPPKPPAPKLPPSPLPVQIVMPKPPAPPLPPKPPMPPVPPSPPAKSPTTPRVIVQDFLQHPPK